MAWRVGFNTRWSCIHSVFSGPVTTQDSDDATVEALSLARGNVRHLFFTDLMSAESRLSIFDIYYIPEKWLAAGASKANRLVLVAPAEGKLWDDVRFYEHRCCSRGWDVKAFSCRQRAIDWLTSPLPANMPDAGDGE
jgi:hypothetical protein